MAKEGFERKLTAILSADVEGYSRLMDDDEEATVRILTSYRTAISSLVQKYRGRVVDSPGDNILAEFKSVVDAVNCAVEIQHDLGEQNSELPDNRKMQFRIGVNLGDVIDEEDRIYGDGVNIAARIESLSEAGGICISHSAYDQIKNKLKLGYEYLGEHKVKNIREPVKAYRVLMAPEFEGKFIGFDKKASKRGWIWVAAAAVVVAVVGLAIWQFYLRRTAVEPASVDKMAHPLPDKPSIAVLPFTNMSDDPEQEYLSDGISEEIITALFSVPELFVIARNSTFTYKGKAVKVQQVSEDLGVQYVLEGSVRKSGDKLRITAQLIDALSGRHLWAETYDRTLEDIFVLQDEITMKIITELQVKITGREGARLRAPCSENLKAYLKYLRALDHYYRFNPEDSGVAKRLTKEAVALDSEYACAYGLLGGIFYTEIMMGASTSPKMAFAKAKEMVDKAIQLNPSLAGPQAMRSKLLAMAGDYEKALATAKKAVEFDPNDLLALDAMNTALKAVGKPEESIPFLKKAIRLDPFSTYYQVNLGFSYFLIGQYEEAIRVCKKVIDIKPNDFFAHLCLTSNYSAAGYEEEARAEATEILRINPRFSVGYLSKALPYTKEDKEFLIGNLRKAGLK